MHLEKFDHGILVMYSLQLKGKLKSCEKLGKDAMSFWRVSTIGEYMKHMPFQYEEALKVVTLYIENFICNIFLMMEIKMSNTWNNKFRQLKSHSGYPKYVQCIKLNLS